jgi:hypothetical protein
MPADLPDPDLLRDILHRRLLRAMFPAATRLARAASGLQPIGDDRQLRACVELARLVPAICGPAREPQGLEKWWRELSDEEREEKSEILSRWSQRQGLSLEESHAKTRQWEREDWERKHPTWPMPDWMRPEHDEEAIAEYVLSHTDPEAFRQVRRARMLRVSENVRKCPIGGDDQIGSGLDHRQWLAIELLAVGRAVGQVARTVGVDPRTVYRWRHACEPFERELHRRRRDLWTDQLRGLLNPALDELNRQLHDPFDRTRFRAAATILRLANLRKAAPVADPDAEPDDR